ncbi:MAG: primosomal protein N' [Kiritimatiellales bacterium]|nr:primosomal protein N' [Kiritimatiellales bacterium]
MTIARIVVNLSLDREFDYRIPEHLRGRVRVGSRVRVPFGKGKGTRVAYVVKLVNHSPYPELKEIHSLEGEQEQIPDNLIRLAQWIADYYCCTKEQSVRAMLPAVVRSGKVSKKRQSFARIAPDIDLNAILPELEKRATKQALLLQTLLRLHHAPVVKLLREADTTRSTLTRLQEKGLVVLEQCVVERDPFADDVVLPTTALTLAPEQRDALDKIVSSMCRRASDVILLHGVTGSGKTEVYLQAIAQCLEDGYEAIVLVPEISLTPQTTERFRSRFGETVSVLHSGLSDGERFDEWMKIHEGRTKIAVGARSALFAPFRRLGLIVVDEEHENTYKQEEAPRYHARDVAVVRGKFENATVVLGSATPALESYYNCERGKYVLAELPRRVDNQVMPFMEVVDMRAEAALHGGAQIFSRRLQDMIRDRLDRGEQTILFLNRRGYASQMMCMKCGYVAECEECSVSYTYHRHEHRLLCHLCGSMRPAPDVCPQCGDKDIRYAGLGTEKVEALAHKFFRKANIARMDSDTMTAKDSYRKTLNAFRSGRIDILIGTQMIAKGLHFPNVTLVGVIFADLGLRMPDFRAAERTFQLLTQVAGRAGRGERPGRVIVQSYTPFHPALQYALETNYQAFAKEELEARKALAFPPVTHMVLVHFRGSSEMKTARIAEEFAEALRPRLEPAVEVAGPMPAPISKIRNKFRYQLTLRGGSILALSRTLREAVIAGKKPQDVDVHVDIDPQSLL